MNEELVKELETLGLAPDDAKIVSLLLTSSKTLTSNEIAEILELPRHQIYSSLSKLEKQRFIKQISFKPKKYFSDIIVLNESLNLFEQQYLQECNTYKEARTSDEKKCFQILGLDDDQVDIYKYLLTTPATRNELVDKFESMNYEKVRNITDLLIGKTYTRKIASKGKSIIYVAVPLQEIINNRIESLKTQYQDKKNRIERITSLLESTLADEESSLGLETVLLS
ncbi:MAG: helix-turn-helix domain-containing protein, partial [Candidatus Thorarchaeota archaeon]